MSQTAEPYQSDVLPEPSREVLDEVKTAVKGKTQANPGTETDTLLLFVPRALLEDVRHELREANKVRAEMKRKPLDLNAFMVGLLGNAVGICRQVREQYEASQRLVQIAAPTPRPDQGPPGPKVSQVVLG